MNTEVKGSPSFAHIQVELMPGETIVAEPDAMSSMSSALDMKTQFNGGLISAFLKKVFGGESLLVNHFTNNTVQPLHITLVQPTPGDIHEMELTHNQVLNFQPGAYIASEPSIRLGVRYAGIKSFIAREGLFKLQVSGNGKVWYGAYGGLLEKEINGEYIVDSSHLVAYPDSIKLKIQLAGGLFSSIFSGEGLVTRLVGKGRVTIQTRSLTGLKNWLNPRL